MRYVLIIFLILSSFTLNNYIVPEDNSSLSLKNVKKEIIRLRILFPDIVLSQVRLETGNLSYVHNNNLFGFTGIKYFYFERWQESVKYYRGWQQRHYHGGDYYQFLINIHYAADTDYVKKLKQFKD